MTKCHIVIILTIESNMPFEPSHLKSNLMKLVVLLSITSANLEAPQGNYCDNFLLHCKVMVETSKHRWGIRIQYMLFSLTPWWEVYSRFSFKQQYQQWATCSDKPFASTYYIILQIIYLSSDRRRLVPHF